MLKLGLLFSPVIYPVIFATEFRCRDSCSPAMTVSEVSGKESETKDEPENGA